jgi:hypothetical protein
MRLHCGINHRITTSLVEYYKHGENEKSGDCA